MERNIKGNKYLSKKDYSLILIKSNKYGLKKIKVDNEDVPKLKNHTWGLIQKGKYVVTSRHNLPGRPSLYLHRFLFNEPKGSVIDHINHDTHDNRKSNLRICTPSQNIMNRRILPEGVMFSKQKGKWRAYIQYRGNSIHLGYFKDRDHAVVARATAEICLFREFAPRKRTNI